MAQKSRFFDSVGGDRTYTSAAWADVIAGLSGDGVVATGNELAVSENSPAGMSVRVNTGKAFIQGYFFEVYSAQEVVTIGAAHATLPRIDRVVVRRDLTNRQAVLAVIAGTAAASPTAPALTQNVAGNWELPLAQVLVPAAAASIVNANITDERGARAKGTDIDAILAATGAHAHTGVAGQGTKIDWSSILSKPSTFAPSVHTHADASSGGNVPWGNVSGKPSTFAPDDHTHAGAGTGGQVSHGVLSGVTADQHHAKSHAHDGADGSGTVAWGSVTGKPSTFAPSAHAVNHKTGGSDAITAAEIGGMTKHATTGTAGTHIYIGTTTPASPTPAEGDIWVKA